MRSAIGYVFERPLVAVENVWVPSWALVDGFFFQSCWSSLGT